MFRRNGIVLLIIMAVFAFAVVGLVVNPIFGRDGMRLDLDLQGGVHLVYKLQYPAGATDSEKANYLNQTKLKITNRIDKFGVANPVVQTQGSDLISVKLPGYSDVALAQSQVEQIGFLEFREAELKPDGNPAYLSDYLGQETTAFINTTVTGNRIFAVEANTQDRPTTPPVAILQKNVDGTYQFLDSQGNPTTIDNLKKGDTQIPSWMPAQGDSGTPLTGSLLSSATPEISNVSTGAEVQVKIVWNSEGSAIFDQIAKRLYGQSYPKGAIAIFLDNNLLSSPVIQAASFGGTAVITGSFTQTEAKNLSDLLSSGSLPIPLELEYSAQPLPTLGAQFIDLSVKAGIIAFILIVLFLIAYYKIPGALAGLALIFYAAVVLAIFKLFPITLNLAGIGGFVLSLGMAVDANVLIFERMKEEIRNGKTLKAAIESGFKRAWLAIRDSNITTFIACIVLYFLGSFIIGGEAVQGFAATLFIGVAISMFTAITVTRALLNAFIGTSIGKNTSLFSAWSGRK